MKEYEGGEKGGGGRSRSRKQEEVEERRRQEKEREEKGSWKEPFLHCAFGYRTVYFVGDQQRLDLGKRKRKRERKGGRPGKKRGGGGERTGSARCRARKRLRTTFPRAWGGERRKRGKGGMGREGGTNLDRKRRRENLPFFSREGFGLSAEN